MAGLLVKLLKERETSEAYISLVRRRRDRSSCCGTDVLVLGFLGFPDAVRSLKMAAIDALRYSVRPSSACISMERASKGISGS